MGLPKDLVKPAVNYTYPTERDYQDTSLSTIDNLQVTDPNKSGGDYGIIDPRMTESLIGMTSETGNGSVSIV